MKIFFLVIGCVAFFERAMAVDSQTFCQFLLAGASVDGGISKIQPHDTRTQISALVEIQRMLNNFLTLAKTGVDQKMSWDSFKMYAAKKGSTTRSTTKTTFEFKPDPQQHEYSKQINGTQ